MGVEFRILGPLEVLMDGAAVAVGGPRQRALLATLLLSANQVVSRDRLIDELSGEPAADSADHALRVQVSRLRKTLSAYDGVGDRLVSRAPGYLLRVGPGELDLQMFEARLAEARVAAGEHGLERAAAALREAESLWRGRPLADLEFERFARIEVDRLEELRLGAVEERIDVELALGRHAVLVAELEALVAKHPLRERLRGQLMLALYRCGRQADALEVYRAGRALMSDQLALEPGRALRRLERSILNQEPELDLPEPARGQLATAISGSARPAPPASSDERGSGVALPAQRKPGAAGEMVIMPGSVRELLEREECLAAIDSLLAGVGSGGGGLLIEGPPGIGKTALLDEACRRGAGLRVLRASGGQLEVDLPFGVVRQLFEPVLRRATDSQRERWFRGPGELASQLVAVASASVGGHPVSSADSAAVRSSIYWLAVALAEDGPLLLLIDDLHWADRESLRWVVFTARRLSGTGIALMIATRAWEPGTDEPLLDALRALPDVSVHRLAALSATATGQLVRAWSGSGEPPEAFAATCHRLSGGNPFLLTQLMREAARVGVAPDLEGAVRLGALVPEGLARAVLLRLRPLGEAAIRLARAVAILGSGATLDRAGELAELSFERAVAEANGLIRAEVLRDADQLEMTHPLVRAAVLGELTSVVRAALHARAARLLAAGGASPEAVGVHLLAAPPGRDQWVVERLLGAAEQARGRGAPEAAARLLERALQEPPEDAARAAVHAALGSALCTAGDARGIEQIRAARELTSDPARRMMLGARLGTPYVFLGRGEEVAAMLREGLDEHGRGDPAVACSIRCALASAPMFGASFDPRGLTAELLEEVGRLGPVPVFLRPAVSSLAMVACAAAFPAAVVAATARLAIGELDAHRAAIAEGFPLLPALLALGLAEDVDGLEERLVLVEDGVRRRGAIALGLCALLCARAMLDLRAGGIDVAVERARTAAELGAESEFSVLRAQSAVALAAALRERGDLDAAELALTDRPPDADSGMWAAAARGELAAIALARGDHATALNEGLAAGKLVDQIGVVNPVVAPWRAVAALAIKAGGEPDRAAAVSSDLLDHARAFGTPAAIGSALRVRAIVLDEPDLIAEAERTLAGSRARLEHARALIDLGAALRRRGQRVRARDPLFAGMEQARGCGSEPLVDRALTELRAAGARPRSVVRSGVEALTPAESRVARLAAGGHTNREIAAELFVSKATVETHLRSVFRKLDVRARGELGARLGGEQPHDFGCR